VTGKRHRSVLSQFFEHVATDLRTGTEREFHERGSGQQRATEQHVVGEPGSTLDREASGEQHFLAAGHLDDGAEQRVLGRGEARLADVAALRGGRFEPVIPPLEGVGG